MLLANFNHFLTQLEQLNDRQVVHVKKILKNNDFIAQIINNLEQRLVDSPECPHCHKKHIIRHGKMGKMQRYRCKSKDCGKTFVATTATPMAKLHYKERWFQYFQAMVESKTLRQAAKDCNICLTTSFRWRHLFLTLPSMLKAKKLEGIIEADETFFRYSQKGKRNLTRKARKRGTKASKAGLSVKDWIPVLTARDRAKNTYEAILPKVTSKAIENEIMDKLVKDCVLCSDGHKAYIKFTNENNLIHKRLNLSQGIRVKEKVFHIQNVNAYHSRLKGWMRRFHGVATKYLENYLGWHRFMEAPENRNKNSWFNIQQQLVKT